MLTKKLIKKFNVNKLLLNFVKPCSTSLVLFLLIGAILLIGNIIIYHGKKQIDNKYPRLLVKVFVNGM